MNSELYPEILKNIKRPPKKLWVDGDTSILKKNCIAVVGSRHCTEYGEKWCEKFVKGLMEYDLVIVSGMAIGIDSVAHNTALKYGGKTIAVLPSNLKDVYPSENKRLYNNIKNRGGLIISEYSPDDIFEKKNLLKRNRIVSGMSICTLVIEAAFRSGTSVTAKMTSHQGKKVFCVPGSLDNSKSLGTNIMIKKGANLVTSVKDIVSHYDFLTKCEVKKNVCVDMEVEEEYADVYKLISDAPIDINLIARMAKLNVSEAITKITMLEIDGKIKRVGGNKVVRL